MGSSAIIQENSLLFHVKQGKFLFTDCSPQIHTLKLIHHLTWSHTNNSPSRCHTKVPTAAGPAGSLPLFSLTHMGAVPSQEAAPKLRTATPRSFALAILPTDWATGPSTTTWRCGLLQVPTEVQPSSHFTQSGGAGLGAG